MIEKVNITVKVNDIEMVVPSKEEVIEIGLEKFIKAIQPFLCDKSKLNHDEEFKDLSDVELFKLCYKVSKKEDNDFDKPLNLIFKNFDFSDIFIATVTECPYDPDCVGKMYICDKNKRTIDDNEYQKIAECMKYIYKMYAKENEEVMRNIDTKATRENISKDLNNLGENRTENIGDLKVGLFGSLDMNKTRKKIKNSLAKLSLEKEN